MRFFCTFTLALMLCMSSFGAVSPQNGNFYISYTDLVIPSAKQDLVIDRHYNSHAPFLTALGLGWGSWYLTKLEVVGMTLKVVNNGAGAVDYFVLKQFKIEDQAKLIADAISKSNLSKGLPALVGKRYELEVEKLKKDEIYRDSMAKQNNVVADIAVGSVFRNSSRGKQKIIKTKEGFERYFPDGKVQFFNPKGQLAGVTEKGQQIILSYSKEGDLASIKSGLNLINFKAINGKIVEITSTNGGKVSYAYEGYNLKKSVDAANNEYNFLYHENSLHNNLIKIVYTQDGSDIVIDYNKEGLVSLVKDRNNEKALYSYGKNPKNPQESWTKIIKKRPGRKDYAIENRYIVAKNEQGIDTVIERTEIANGRKKMTRFLPCCNLPTMITMQRVGGQSKGVTTYFTYDKNKRLKEKKSTTGKFAQISYDEVSNKIARVVNEKGWSEYTYKKYGKEYKLESAKNSKNQALRLIYHSDNKQMAKVMIQSLKQPVRAVASAISPVAQEVERQVLSFEYNNQGKPSKVFIESPQTSGWMKMEYNSLGKMVNVSSSQAKAVSDAVTASLRQMTDIARPSGLDLGI